LLPTKSQYFQCLLCPDSIDIFYTFSAWCDKTFVAVNAYRSSVSEESNRSNRLPRSFSSFPPFFLSFSLFLSLSLSLSLSSPPPFCYLSISFSSSFTRSRAIRRSIEERQCNVSPNVALLELISGIIRARCSLPRKGCHPCPPPAWHFALCAFLSHNGTDNPLPSRNEKPCARRRVFRIQPGAAQSTQASRIRRRRSRCFVRSFMSVSCDLNDESLRHDESPGLFFLLFF